eukprot:scaffold1973_cov399-Prasinococcus_capsulatus_cf.AAC.13
MERYVLFLQRLRVAGLQVSDAVVCLYFPGELAITGNVELLVCAEIRTQSRIHLCTCTGSDRKPKTLRSGRSARHYRVPVWYPAPRSVSPSGGLCPRRSAAAAPAR